MVFGIDTSAIDCKVISYLNTFMSLEYKYTSCWKNVGGKHESGRPGKADKEIEFLTVGDACKATFWTELDFKARAFVSSRVSVVGTLISASAIPHGGGEDD